MRGKKLARPRWTVVCATVIVTLGVAALAGCTRAPATKLSAFTVTAQGTGKGTVTPDTVSMAFSFTRKADDAKTALRLVAGRSNALVKALRGVGIPAKDITTANISVDAVRRWPSGGGESYVVGYQGRVTIKVRTQMIKLAGVAMTTAAVTGATTVSTPSLSLSPARSAAGRSEALAAAASSARANAEIMAKAMGRTVGRAVRITQDVAYAQAGPYSTPYSPDYTNAVYGDAALAYRHRAPVNVSVVAGRQDMQAEVTAVFELK